MAKAIDGEGVGDGSVHHPGFHFTRGLFNDGRRAYLLTTGLESEYRFKEASVILDIEVLRVEIYLSEARGLLQKGANDKALGLLIEDGVFQGLRHYFSPLTALTQFPLPLVLCASSR